MDNELTDSWGNPDFMTFGSFAKSYDDLMKSIYSFSLNFKSVVDYYDSIKTEYNKRFNNNNKANDSIAKEPLVLMPKPNDSIAPNYKGFQYYGDKLVVYKMEILKTYDSRYRQDINYTLKDSLTYIRDIEKLKKYEKEYNENKRNKEITKYKNDSIKEIEHAKFKNKF